MIYTPHTFEPRNEIYSSVDKPACALCELSFDSLEEREEHIASSASHPCCVSCDYRRFLNHHALQYHIDYSAYHQCYSEYEVDFELESNLQIHLEQALLTGICGEDHQSFLDFDDEDDDDDGEEMHT
ncbi:hypothetical protein H0H92_010564 [Tricholoma furcatifolium]|nr:hypothetical protein H0H92_010564 [Tricholoma furcatifolium]